MRASRSCHDSVNPCRAWARSPTMVRLREGQRRSSICHSASVSSWASSTTTCANGPGEQVGAGVGRASVVDQGVAQVLAAQHRHHVHLGVVGRDQVVDDLGPSARARRRAAASLAAPAARRLRVAEPPPGRVEQRQVGHASTPRRPSRCSGRTSSAVEPRARTAAGRRAPTTGRRRGRSARAAARPGRRPSTQLPVLLERSPDQRGSASARRPPSSSSLSRGRAARGCRAAPPRPSSRASLCGVPGSAASNASAQSSGPSQTSAHGRRRPPCPRSAAPRRARRPARSRRTSAADALSRATSGSASGAAVAPSATRSRRVQVCTPSSPRLGSTSAT